VDPNFFKSILFISAHSDDHGTLGVILNRPLGQTLGELDSSFQHKNFAEVPVFEGGPVETEKLIIAAWEWLDSPTSFKLYFGIDLEKINASKIQSEIKMLNFSGEESSKLINGLKIGVGLIAGYLLMMFVMIYGTSVMRSVIEEKTSRIIEIIVSSVKPFQLMLGKIIGNASAGLLQFLIWGILIFIISTVAFSIFGIDMVEMQTAKLPAEQLEAAKQAAGMDKMQLIIQEILRLPILKMFILFIFYFLGGYMLYSSLFAAVGAAVDNETDTQQFMLPIMLPLILGVYVGFATVINDPHGSIAVLFSHIPLTSPIVMLMRVPFGVSWYELAISMTLLVITFVFMVWLAAKIYRVGILMYGKKPTYKDLYKWLKYKG